MNKRKITWLMAAVAVPALVFGAMASTAFAEPGFDPKRASELAHIALLDDSVLEGGNWTTTADDFSTSDPPKTAACNNTFAKMQALEKNPGGDRAARPKNVMEQAPATGEFPTWLSLVTVYKSAASLQRPSSRGSSRSPQRRHDGALSTSSMVWSPASQVKATPYIPPRLMTRRSVTPVSSRLRSTSARSALRTTCSSRQHGDFGHVLRTQARGLEV